MSFEDEFLNFCLSCDGSLSADNEHGPYCSHACRLADLEKGSPTHGWLTSPTTPLYEQPSSSFSSTSSLSWSFPPMGSGFHLPPAIDFKAYRRDSNSETTSRPDTAPASRTSAVLSPNVLTTTVSPTASAAPANPNAQISPEAKEELRRYEGLFDQTRHRSNRSSWA
ncbi:MAG: hypothetical protein Q9162_006990 [Coniocarpon cinnabarinum]